MAKVNRPDTTIPIFGINSNVDELTVFGQATQTKDITQVLTSLEAQRGWGVVGNNSVPPLEWFNSVGYSLSYITSYLLQDGVAQHSSNQEYYTNSITSKNGDVYISNIDNNANDPESDDDNWNSIGITQVSTMLKFRALTKLPQKVYLSGYHTKNDGAFGSHFYRLKGVKTAEVDNGGTIIVITVNSIDYVYELQYQEFLNLEWFGAKGGELNALPDFDNAPIVLNAINSLPDLGGVILIDKHYMTKTTIEIYDKIGVTINGIGGNTSCSFRCVEDVDVLHIKSLSNDPNTCYGHSLQNIWLSGFKDDLIPADGTKTVLRLEETQLLTINNVYLEDAGNQLWCKNVNSSNFSNMKIEGRNNILIENAHLSNTWSNIIGISEGRGSNSEYGLKVKLASLSSISISNINLRAGNADYGVHFEDSGQVHLSDFVIRNFDQGVLFDGSNNNSLEGFKITDALGCISYNGTTDNNKVANLIAEESNNIYTVLGGSHSNNSIGVLNTKDVNTKNLSTGDINVKYYDTPEFFSAGILNDITGVAGPYVVALDAILDEDDDLNALELDAGFIKINDAGLYQFNIQADIRLASTDSFCNVSLVESANTANALATAEGSASSNTTCTPSLSHTIKANSGDKFTISVSSGDPSFNIDNSRTKVQVYKVC